MKKFIIFILIIAVIAGGAIFAINKVNDVKTEEENKPFTVLSSDGVVLDKEHDTTFFGGVKYEFNVSKAFTLSMLPNTENEDKDFFFTVDGANKQFFAELKLLNAFNVDITKDGFVISAPSGSTIKSILQSIYPDSKVDVPEDVANSTDKLFTLVISDKNKTEKVEITFGLTVMSIDIPREIVF